MATVTSESYAAGETDHPLLEETIGANLERHRRRHGDREALVEVATGRRWTYAELDADVDALGPGADRGRDREGRPGRHLGAQLRRVDDRRSTPPRRSARSWSTSTRPTAPTSSRTCCNQSGMRLLISRDRRSRPATTAPWSTRCAPSARRCERVVFLGTADWDRSCVDRRRRRCRGCRRRRRPRCARRPDQHPVHLGHHRASPRARR